MDMDSTIEKEHDPHPPLRRQNRNSKNSEKRKERSKIAARCRRSKESEIFNELALCLPLTESTKTSLDKGSIVRLTLCELKLKNVLDRVITKKENVGEASIYDSLLMNAMGGFIIIISNDGFIVYCSDNMVIHLGLSQLEMMGQSIFEFVHPCDESDVNELLMPLNKKNLNGENSSFLKTRTFRMKSNISSKKRNVHVKTSGYKVINFTGRQFDCSKENDNSENFFIGVGEPIVHPSDVQIPLNKQTFLTRHTPDMKCEFVDENIYEFLGYEIQDLIGKSFYEFHHVLDWEIISKAFKSLTTKGQIETERYRFLAKNGGWIWVVTQATLIYSSNSNNSRPSSIVCLHFVTSGIENSGDILSEIQMNTASSIEIDMGHLSVKQTSPPRQLLSKSQAIELDSTDLTRAQTLGEKKKIEDMDLTHLAPIAGDACIPINVPLIDDMIKNYEENDMEFCQSEEMITNSPDSKPINQIVQANIDPMFSNNNNNTQPVSVDENEDESTTSTFNSELMEEFTDYLAPYIPEDADFPLLYNAPGNCFWLNEDINGENIDGYLFVDENEMMNPAEEMEIDSNPEYENFINQNSTQTCNFSGGDNNKRTIPNSNPNDERYAWIIDRGPKFNHNPPTNDLKNIIFEEPPGPPSYKKVKICRKGGGEGGIGITAANGENTITIPSNMQEKIGKLTRDGQGRFYSINNLNLNNLKGPICNELLKVNSNSNDTSRNSLKGISLLKAKIIKQPNTNTEEFDIEQLLKAKGRKRNNGGRLLTINSDNLIQKSSLYELTSYDCQVNAPVTNGNILQGAELLQALESSEHLPELINNVNNNVE